MITKSYIQVGIICRHILLRHNMLSQTTHNIDTNKHNVKASKNIFFFSFTFLTFKRFQLSPSADTYRQEELQQVKGV